MGSMCSAIRIKSVRARLLGRSKENQKALTEKEKSVRKRYYTLLGRN